MRRKSIITTILVLGAAAAMAQHNGITVTEVNMTNTAEGPRLDMNVSISPGAVTNLQGIAVVPTLVDKAGHSASFPPVLVNGKNRGQIYERHEKFGYTEIVENPPYLVMNIDSKHPGGNVDYSAPITGEPWMANASLNLAFVLVSPAGERQSYSTAVTGTSVITLPDHPEVTTAPRVTEAPTVIAQTQPVVPTTPAPQQSVTQTPPVTETPPTIAQAPPVVPTTPPVAGAVHTASGSANLDFDVASSSLRPDLGRNGQELAAIDQILGRVAATPGAMIVGVTITGYSSPDGRYETNAALSYDRALAFSRYLQTRHGILSAIIKIRAVGEDWSGLRAAIAGGLFSYPSDVIGIIDSSDAPDAKESRLRRLSGGKIWQRMEKEVFPRMRKIDYSIDYMISE